MHAMNCIICLRHENIVNITQKKDNDVNDTLKLKLHFLVPEVNWLDHYHICEECIKDLITACRFKEKCLHIQLNKWKAETDSEFEFFGDFKPENQCQSDDNISVGNDVENQAEQLFICYLCNKHYIQKDDLIKHFEADHKINNSTKYKRKESCASCGRKFVSSDSLKEHILICDGIRRHCKSKAEYQCLECGKFYTTQKILNAHRLKCDKESFKKSEYKCTKCNKFYQSERTLRYHESEGCRKDDQENKLFLCKFCNESVSTSKELEKHLSLVHKDVLLNCDQCQLTFDSKQDLLSHKKINHKTKKSKYANFTCEVCREEFTHLRGLIKHCLDIHSLDEKSIKPYECEICKIRLRTSTNLSTHKLYHDRVRSNICSYCGKSFITKNDLTSHEVIHFDVRKYKCEKCGKAFKTNTNLRTHTLIVHTDPVLWKYHCEICGKKFPQKTSFEQHQKRHLGEKNFSCQLCDKMFTSNGELQGHLNGHLNVRAYKCEHCGKAYRRKHTYNVHLTKIHGIGNATIRIREKNYGCSICPGKFTGKMKLARHMCTHSGVKPYLCYVCDKRFIDKSYLKHHLKAIHKIDEPNIDNYQNT